MSKPYRQTDVIRVEPRYEYRNLATSATTTLVTGQGVVHSINVGNAGATGNAITVYDNTAGSGTIIYSATPPVTGLILLDTVFVTGLTVVLAGTTPPTCTVAYQGF
jgi:hypothetical protein